MSTLLRVSPVQLTSMGSHCHRTAADVRAQHHALRNQLAPVVGSDWTGVAARQFLTLYGQFTTSAEGLTSSLEAIGRLLDQAAAGYTQVDQQIAASFRA